MQSLSLYKLLFHSVFVNCLSKKYDNIYRRLEHQKKSVVGNQGPFCPDSRILMMLTILGLIS